MRLSILFSSSLNIYKYQMSLLKYTFNPLFIEYHCVHTKSYAIEIRYPFQSSFHRVPKEYRDKLPSDTLLVFQSSFHRDIINYFIKKEISEAFNPLFIELEMLNIKYKNLDCFELSILFSSRLNTQECWEKDTVRKSFNPLFIEFYNDASVH